ncbi:MAG: hypothetical protein JWP41_2286 [Ramlibacter sp.]|nr:hypothetical protein [Ramlibacter sp.]
MREAHGSTWASVSNDLLARMAPVRAFISCTACPRTHIISGGDYDTALRHENAHKADREQEFNRGAH